MFNINSKKKKEWAQENKKLNSLEDFILTWKLQLEITFMKTNGKLIKL